MMSMRRRGIGRLCRRKAERRLGVLGWDMGLLRLAVQGAPFQKGVVLLFLQPVRSVGALLVAAGNVTGRRFAFGFRLGAFQDDEIAGHECSGLFLVGRRCFFFFGLGGLLAIGQAEERRDG